MIMCLGSGAFADSNLSDAEFFAELEEMYESQKVGGIVRLDDGGDYRITERTLTIDEENPENSVIDTQYEKVSKARFFTLERAASQSHKYFTKYETATLYATFEYDTVNAPTVYRSYYTFTDYDSLYFVSLDSSVNSLTKTLSHTLSFNAEASTGDKGYTITLKCGKNGE